MGQWNAEEMVINYKAENPAETLRREHAAFIQPLFQEYQQTAKGSFFVAIYENEEIQRPNYGDNFSFFQVS